MANDARLLREEIFGAVAPITAISDEGEAIGAATDREFDLVVYASKPKSELRVVEQRETGMVGPYDGTRAFAR